jgi:hypothetical protein
VRDGVAGVGWAFLGGKGFVDDGSK